MRYILITAYACEPLKGSEQGVGWNWVLQMAKNNKVHVITRANNRTPIESHLPADVAENITFHYYDTTEAIRKLKKRAKGLYFYYFCWQLGIVPLVRTLIKQHDFDYSMHLTFGSMWMPTFLPFFKIPFIWGPVGGGDGEPSSFLKELPIKQKLMQYARLVMNRTSFLNPAIVIPSYKAVSILTRTDDCTHVIPKKFQSKVDTILETSMESEVFNFSVKHKVGNSNVIKLVFTGRLMPSKNVISIVRALHFIPSSYQVQLTIIGSGSEKAKIKQEIKQLKLSGRIQLISEISRNEVLSRLVESDIYLFPSLREGGSWALMEAMAIGLPVVCLNWSGMKVITDDTSAIRLPVTNPGQMPKDMAEAICRLIDNPELRYKMGLAARERIRNVFNWEAKGKFMEELLDDLDAQK